MTDDERSPRADIVHVARAVRVPDERPFTALEKKRGAADAPERTDRGVHAARRAELGAVEEPLALLHALRWKRFSNARDAAATSGAQKMEVMTATASAPATRICVAFSSVMPPMATIGTRIARFARSSSSKGACTAPGLTLDGKKLPKAT